MSKQKRNSASQIVSGTLNTSQKVWHNKIFSDEKPLSEFYKSIDNDLARDNIENDIPTADLQDI